MTFEEFKKTFQWVFNGQGITYEARTYAEAQRTAYGQDLQVYYVNIEVTSKTSNGNLKAETFIPAQHATEFIEHMELYLNPNNPKDQSNE